MDAGFDVCEAESAAKTWAVVVVVGCVYVVTSYYYSSCSEDESVVLESV